MFTQLLSAYWRSRRFTELHCYIIFLFLMSPVVYAITETEKRTVFHLLLLVTGFITFTFLEYIAHRFWMHGEERIRDKNPRHHLNLHHHPGIKISQVLRCNLLLVNLLMVISATRFDNYFTFFTGLYTGFVYYCFVHAFLHSPLARKIFPHLLASHIHHHCRYPDRCFSTCHTGWDKLFNTSVPKKEKLSEQIVQFYFRKSGQYKSTDSSTFAALLKKKSNEYTTTFVGTGTTAP